MLLTQTAEYALRAMATLAGLGPGEAMRSADLADHTGIPVHYLSKVMRRLVVKRLVTSRKGHGGGFSLGRAAGKITFAEILDVDPYFQSTAECAFGWGACHESNPCPLHSTWSKLKDSFQSWARTTTLAQVQKQYVRPQVQRRIAGRQRK